MFVHAQFASIGSEHVLRWWYLLGGGSLVAAWYLSAQRHDDGEGQPREWRAAADAGRRGSVWIEIGFAASVYAVAEVWSTVGTMTAWTSLRRSGERSLGAPGVDQAPVERRRST